MAAQEEVLPPVLPWEPTPGLPAGRLGEARKPLLPIPSQALKLPAPPTPAPWGPQPKASQFLPLQDVQGTPAGHLHSGAPCEAHRSQSRCHTPTGTLTPGLPPPQPTGLPPSSAANPLRAQSRTLAPTLSPQALTPPHTHKGSLTPDARTPRVPARPVPATSPRRRQKQTRGSLARGTRSPTPLRHRRAHTLLPRAHLGEVASSCWLPSPSTRGVWGGIATRLYQEVSGEDRRGRSPPRPVR